MRTFFCIRWGVVAVGLFGRVVVAPAGEPGEEPVTMARALKLGVEGLTQQTGSSEAGQDHAAWLYATAKRIETDHALAQRGVQLVIDLNAWREALAKCRRGAYALAYIINGGGTMYTHGQARDGAAVEDFLSGLAPRFPLPEGKGSAKAAKQIEDSIALVRKLKPFDLGDAKAARKAKADLAAEVRRVVADWTELKSMVERLPAADAEKFVAFAADTLDWVKEDGGK